MYQRVARYHALWYIALVVVHDRTHMDATILRLGRYIEMVTGASFHARAAPDALQPLPAYMGSLYAPFVADILDHTCLLLLHKGRELPTPAETVGQFRLASRHVKDDVVFVFEKMPAFIRQRLVRHRVPFVVPERQMYLPTLAADFREKAVADAGNRRGETAHLSGPAQLLLLYHIQHPQISGGRSLREWARLLGYSPITASRIASELLETRLCDVRQVGRKTILDLGEDRKAIWEKALPFLRSPVRERVHARHAAAATSRWPKAGIAALSESTMLGSDERPAIAMATSEYARALVEGTLTETPAADEEGTIVERWRYRPALLCGEGARTVDPLSLYLSLRDDPDERVQAALKELLEAMQW